jgi:hypothetical protein
MIGEHKTDFAGFPVLDWQPGQSLPDKALPRLILDYDSDGKWSDLLAELLQMPGADQLIGLVVGNWQGSEFGISSEPVVEALVVAGERLPDLKVLFIGDITYEENELSWIEQGDISPLFAAFPNLEWLGVRGGNGLVLGMPRHEKLKGLVIETGGMPGAVFQSVVRAQLPQLEHLELWLGEENYGAEVAATDLKPLLNGDLFPNLKYLGLRNSEMQDEIAQALHGAPVLKKIRVLDLSLGTLTDKGAQALLDDAAITKLEKLDLHHHFCSDEMMEKLKALPCEVDVSEQEAGDQDGDETYRYVAHGE